MERFALTADAVEAADVIGVSVQDTYVDSGIGVAQVSWNEPKDEGRRHTGLVEVALAEGISLSRLMHRTLYVRRSDIRDANTRFDLDE